MAVHLGRYELGEELGRGAMAFVYRGYDPRLQRELAIKMLRPEFAREESHRRNFLTEAHAAGQLAHPGIVTIYDVGDHDGRPFLAMELLRGPTLQERLDEQGWLGADQVVDIALQLAEALDYAHRHGVVHRDVKPENVVWLGAGRGIKLTDFGIARVRQAGARDDGGDIVGTPEFMAPEQIRGDPLDGRTDLYALGVLMYALLGHRKPFVGDSVRDTLTAIIEQPPPPLQPRDPNAPPALIDIITTLMAKRPADRYQTGAELAEDLRQVARELEREQPGGWRIPLSVRWPIAMGAIAAIAMALGTLAIYHQQRTAMTDVVFDYGGTLLETIAAESGEDLLLEDTTAVQATVDHMQRNRHMAYLSIADRHGEVVASTLPVEVGGAGHWLLEEPVRETDDGQRIYHRTAGDHEAFLFQGPIRYGGREIGQAALAMPTEPLDTALRTTLLALGALFLAVVGTVLTASYIMARRLAVPLRVLGNAIEQVTQGRFAYRIRLRRSDEIGGLFRAYNRMAEALQARVNSPGDDASNADKRDPPS